MARVEQQAARRVGREAFLDAAERLIRADGYERMSVQDVLDAVGASKGAFYHYFDSKDALLEAVVERMGDAVLAVVEPIVADPVLPAAAKLQAVLAAGGAWKAERSDLLLALVRSWYGPHNDLVRARIARSGAARLAPLVARVIRQGAAEGVFDASSPDDSAAVLVALLVGSGDAFARLVVDRLDDRIPFAEAERRIAAYEEAIERVLGLAPGSLVLVDPAAMHVWFA